LKESGEVGIEVNISNQPKLLSSSLSRTNAPPYFSLESIMKGKKVLYHWLKVWNEMTGGKNGKNSSAMSFCSVHQVSDATNVFFFVAGFEPK
jgi:hypothetical protein